MAINYQGGNDAVITGAFAPMMQTMQRNYLYEQQQRDQQRKEQEALTKSLSSEMSKLNANGLRRADKDDFINSYSELKNTFHKYRMSKDLNTRGELAMELNEKLMNAQNIINQSKEIAKLENNFSNGLVSLANKGRVDEARTFLNSTFNKKASEINNRDFDISKYLYTYDPSKIESAFSKIAQTSLGSTAGNRVRTGTLTTSGGKNYDDYTITKTVPDNLIFEEVSRMAQGGNRDVQNYVQEIMTSQGVDFNAAVARVAEEQKPKFTSVKEERLSADKSKGITVNVNTASDFTSPQNAIVDNYVIAKATQDIKTTTGTTPKGGEVALKNYLQFNQTQDIGGVLKGIDPETGKTVNPEGYATKARVLGLGTDQQGRVYAHISYNPEGDSDETKTMIVNADRYLNTANMTKTKKEYVNELARRGVKIQGQSSTTSSSKPQSSKPNNSVKGLPKGGF